MTTATLTPFDLSEPTKVGKFTYRKQVLPLDETITYKGRKITFNREFLTDLAESFKKGAYDQVPFVFADAENAHNLDPERFRGEVVALDLAEDGLYATVTATEEGAKAIDANPRLGVSARIVEGIAKSDGRTFGRAINHVLATLNPRVVGMKPWETVDLSEDENTTETTDLTSESYTKENDVATLKTKDGEKEINLADLSDEEFQQLLDLAAESADDDDADEDDESNEDEDDSNDDSNDGEEDDEDDNDSSDTDLSEEIKQFREFRAETAKKDWQRDRRQYVKDGVPPFLLDLAEPVLSGSVSTVIDLSDGTKTDASSVIRDMLDGVKGVVDVRPELGHQIDLSEDDEQDATSKMLDQWNSEYGSL